jgi:hypothetical protein
MQYKNKLNLSRKNRKETNYYYKKFILYIEDRLK